MTDRTDRISPPETAPRTHVAASVVLAVILIALGLWTLQEFLRALVWAGVLAIAVWPTYQRAHRQFPPGRHNVLLPLAFTAAIALVLLVPLAFAGVRAAREAHAVFDWIDGARRSGIQAPDWLAHLPFAADAATGWWRDNLADPAAADSLLHRVDRAEVLLASRDIGARVAHRTVQFGFTLTALFFLFRDGDTLAAQMRQASHRLFGPGGERVGRQIIASVHGTVDGLVLVGLGVGVVMGVVYAFTGVPHPALLGAVTAVGAMIPLGAPLVFGVAALLLVVQGLTTAAIVVLAIGMAVTFVADHFIRPALIGGATQLPFLWVLLGILGGVATWGLLGLFLGPAIMAALILLWREWTAA